MRIIIERIEIRKPTRDEIFVAFVESGRVRNLVKRFVAFRQIPDVIDEIASQIDGDFAVDFFDVSFENMDDVDEHMERFI